MPDLLPIIESALKGDATHSRPVSYVIDVSEFELTLPFEKIRHDVHAQYGGTWGVIVDTDKDASERSLHWKFPYVSLPGVPTAFCADVCDSSL